MKKQVILLVLCIVMILTLDPSNLFASVDFPGTVTAPANLAVTPVIENGEIYTYNFGISIPDNLNNIPDQWETWYESNDASELSVYLECDYKLNSSGSWHYAASWDQVDGDAISGKMVDFGVNQTIYMEPDNFPGLSTPESMLTSNTVYFRSRFAIVYYDGNAGAYVKYVSPWSNTSAIGKEAQSASVTLVAPVLTKAEVKSSPDTGAPYFEITESIPNSIKAIDNTSDTVLVNMEYRKDAGQWVNLSWLSSLTAVMDFNPENAGAGNDIDIKAAKYEVRCRFALNDPVQQWSPYSNILTVGTPAFYSHASSWAQDYLNQAEDLGIITEKMQGADMSGPITREEFAEIAVKFYEMVTGKDAVPVATNPFKDCINPEVLKAFNLKITAGTGNGTTFEPGAKLLRQQMATMITNTLRACFTGFDLKNYSLSGQKDFADQKSFAAYSVIPAKFMAKYGITTVANNMFGPNDTCTREQATIFLVKSFLYKDQYIK